MSNVCQLRLIAPLGSVYAWVNVYEGMELCLDDAPFIEFRYADTSDDAHEPALD